MTRVQSEMLTLGTTAPDFTLPDLDGKTYSLAKDSSAYLVMFICNHCPFVIHVRDELARIGHDFGKRNVAIYAINSNDTDSYPQDGPEAMKKESASAGYSFPYLIDADQSLAHAYKAACTPDFYLFDSDKRLVYRGQLDDSRPGNQQPVNGADLRAALEAVLANEPVSDAQKPSVGCNIKWKIGNEPDYFR